MKLKSYAYGEWIEGADVGQSLFNAVNGDFVASISSKGVDYKDMLEYGRNIGKTLRNYTIHERARMLKELAFYLIDRKEKYYELSKATGATRTDSWIDIEGGIGTLFTYASKVRREMTDNKFHIDGKYEPLSKNGTFIGQHICSPLQGVAIHINAFNFPVWGMLEKLAPSIAAGMPIIIKPASLTAYLTELMVQDIIKSKILPKGSVQLICGSTGNLLDFVMHQDVVTFTGSAYTGRKLKSHNSIISNSVRFNMEADSLNFSILGDKSGPNTEEFELFIKEVTREMTVKAGQKCTAIRRVIVPEKFTDDVINALKAKLDKNIIGDPSIEGTRMGPLAGKDQVIDVIKALKGLKKEAKVVYSNDDFELNGGSKENGAFLHPTLLLAEDPLSKTAPHTIEAFGPISTILPYKNTDEAIELIKKGEGSLVGSIFTNNSVFAKEITLGTASYHGRLHFVNRNSAKENTGHGSPLPHMVHGGPGRAGGGEELGGVRSVLHYMQRTAIQANPDLLTAITGEYLPGAKKIEDVRHPFTKHYEELEIGDSYTSGKRTITEADIVNFANLSWDHFYAHTDVTSLAGTIFEQRVAHGYFVISAAAGLFVERKKGPVLANYGLDELRFTMPVYAGDTIYTILTCKSKQIKERKTETEVISGVVKWQVEVFNQREELIALGTILTLVKRQDQKAII